MPTLRLIYLSEHQYQHAFVTPAEDETNNTTTAELPSTTTLPRIHEQSRFSIDDATRNASSNNKKSPAVGGEEKMVKQERDRDHDHEEDDDYLDTLLQEAIDEVNARSFGRQVPHEEIITRDEESENESDSSPSLEFVDAVQQIQHEMVSSHKGIENGDSTSSPVDVDAIQQKSGNKRKRRAPKQSFDDHFNDLMAFKAGFKWCLQKKERELSLIKAFYDHFNDLMAFKAKYGHCDVSTRGEDASLGRWCSVVRGSYKKIQNNQNPKMKLSDEQIQRLNDAGFKWCL